MKESQHQVLCRSFYLYSDYWRLQSYLFLERLSSTGPLGHICSITATIKDDKERRNRITEM